LRKWQKETLLQKKKDYKVYQLPFILNWKPGRVQLISEYLRDYMKKNGLMKIDGSDYDIYKDGLKSTD
jgi:hypothetical protein